MEKKLSLMLFLLMISVLLIGCTKSAKETKAPDNDAKVDEVEVAQGGVLDFAFNVQPSTLDAHFTTDTATRDISLHIYEPLVTLNDSLEVEPMLAESYDVTEDGKIITFHLREGIQFHNGEELTADDVVASMERWQEMSSQAQTYLEGTKYVAEDKHTVIAHIQNPTTLDMFVFADMTQFAAIMPESIVKKAGKELVEEFIGTGPYQFGEWRQDQHIHLKKFADYQSRSEPANGLSGEKKALVDEIYFHIVTDSSTRVAGIQSGEYDIANQIPQDNFDMLEANSNVKNAIYSNSFPSLVFNKKTGVFSNQKARQAVNEAIDLEEMLIAAYGDEKFYITDHALVKEEQTGWYTDVGSDVYNKNDPEHAKQLLVEAGYDGEEVVIITSREHPDYYKMSVVVQQQLEAIGMVVKLEISDWGTVLERRSDENAYDIFFTGFAFRPMPIQYLFFNPEWLGWTDSEELDRLMNEILYAGSQEEAQKFSAEFHEAFRDYLPIIKPGNSTAIVSMGAGVDGLQFITGPILWNVSIEE